MLKKWVLKMLKDQTNQDFKDIVSLMGQKVFISSSGVQDGFIQKKSKVL